MATETIAETIPAPETWTRDRVNRAVQYVEPGTTKTAVAELPVPAPGPGEVLVRITQECAIPTTDSPRIRSDSRSRHQKACTVHDLPAHHADLGTGQVGGHEGVGEVIELGAGVVTPALGSKVGIKYAADACLNCDNCLIGGETSCTSAKISGYHHPGTFQQYLVSAAKYVTPIPDGIDLAGAAPLMCAGITVYAALKRAETRPGDFVLVSGAGGGLGHLAIQYAKALGARVIALDVGAKEALCRALGADAFLDFTRFETDEDLARAVRKTAPAGVKTVLCCVTSKRAYGQSMGFLGFRGTLVCLGVPDGMGAAWPIPGAVVGLFIDKEVRIIGLKAGNKLEAKECLDIAAMGRVKTVYELRPMESLTQIFEDMEAGKIIGRAVLDLR